MSFKRKHSDFADSSAAQDAHKKHRTFQPRNNFANANNAKSKRPRINRDSDQSASKHALKSRIRDLKRLLAHVDEVGDHKMSASNRIERERELAACEHELAEMTEQKRQVDFRTKMIERYHQVRFFDRQKALRNLKRLQKELNTAEDDKKAELEEAVHNAEVDVNYTRHYPHMKAYSSLNPRNATEDTERGDRGIWKEVEQAMEDGTLDQLRERTEGLLAAAPKRDERQPVKDRATKKKPTVPEGINRRERRAAEAKAQEEAEESDGGFFE